MKFCAAPAVGKEHWCTANGMASGSWSPASKLSTMILAVNPMRILEANADITERQRAEAELNQSQEQLRALADRLLKAREEEATRIARELHDQFGRHLTTIKMDVRSIERDLAGELTSEVARVLREKAQTIGHNRR